MSCPVCGVETNGVDFCPNCGAKMDHANKTITIDVEDEMPGENIYGVLKKIIKEPSASHRLTSKHLFFGLLSIALYSVIIATYIYFSMRNLSANLQSSFDDLGMGSILGQSVQVSFVDFFLLPFIGFFALQIIMALLIFIVSRITGNIPDLRGLIAQYGGFLFPFTFIFVLGILFALLSFNWLATVAFLIATAGVIFMLPAILTKSGIEKKTGGTDRIYLLLVVYFIGMLIMSFVARSYIEAMISNFMGGLTNLF